MAISSLEVAYLGVLGTLIAGIIYVTFVEVFNTGIRIRIGGESKSGRKKEKKKATASKAKTKNT
ncbi:hypothetical protein [Stygiolobus caldivivus]|uniref:Uncharacterized protein n=1 Tax=Stygiolobus caldivivus TaxID=2824673 RepID=A0A8D5U7C7_9CREN|nr:hypothetical protein [Stygiolobus caldivivus]BCU70572.1 hypothetical protein KN1_18690 [Stygiolobus caldivivus]